MVDITSSDQYEKERAKIIIEFEDNENKLRKKYDIRIENIDGKHTIVGKDPSTIVADGLKQITKIRNDRDNKLKELEEIFQKSNLNKSKEKKMPDDSSVEAIADRRDMVKNLDRLIKMQEDQQKEIKNACTGIDCIKEDLKKLQHNHNTSGTKFESKFAGLESKFDNKFSGLETKSKESCDGLDCIKNQIKDLGSIKNQIKDLGSKVNFHTCDNCNMPGIQDGSSFCPNCGREVEWFEPDGKTPLKGWKPLSNLNK